MDDHYPQEIICAEYVKKVLLINEKTGKEIKKVLAGQQVDWSQTEPLYVLKNGERIDSFAFDGWTTGTESVSYEVGLHKIEFIVKNGIDRIPFNIYITVVPKATTIKGLHAVKKGFKIKYGKGAWGCDGYQIRYSTNSDMTGAKIKNIKNDYTTEISISNLLSKKRYYVQVRTYGVDGKKYYSSWSNIKEIVTK
jgi:hypothetical protein